MIASQILNKIEDVWKQSPEACISMMENAMPGKTWHRMSPHDHLKLMREYIVRKEWHERMKRNLPPHHCNHIGEIFFSYVGKDVIDAYLNAAISAGSRIDLACALFIQGERERCEGLFAGPQGYIGNAVNFSPDFPAYEGPGYFVARDLQPDDLDDTIFLSCSGNYWKFAEPFIRSIKAKSKAKVHLHMMDFGSHEGTEIADGLSYENPKAGPGYYHAMRFVRLAHWRHHHKGNVWLMDVDALMNANPNVMFNGFQMRGKDIAVRVRPGRLEPWNQFNASVVGFRDTSGAKCWLNAIARYVMAYRENIPWGLDQLAMFCTYEVHRPTIELLGPLEVDYDYDDRSVVWCNSGGQKHKIGGAGREKYYERLKLYQENASERRESAASV